jgi:hypothetical protein
LDTHTVQMAAPTVNQVDSGVPLPCRFTNSHAQLQQHNNTSLSAPPQTDAAGTRSQHSPPPAQGNPNTGAGRPASPPGLPCNQEGANAPGHIPVGRVESACIPGAGAAAPKRVPISKASMRIHALPLHMVRSTLHLPVIAHCLQGTVLHRTPPWRLLRNHQHPANQRHHSHKQWTSMLSKGLLAHWRRASTTSDCSHPQQYMTSRLANAHMLTLGGWVSHSQLLCSMSWTQRCLIGGSINTP